MAKKTKKLNVNEVPVRVIQVNNQDYICITDMIKAKDGDFFVTDWLRNRNTLEFIATWESMYNENFNYGEFAIIRNQSGLNSFKVSVKEWTEKTNSIGLIAKTGRYGGTYAHKDIALEFGTWISPIFKLYLIKEFQRLKELESNEYFLEWQVARVLSKVNYRIHTDAIKDFIIPESNLPKNKAGIEYAKEADILNLAMWGCTAREWREANVKLSLEGRNIRDIASINELTVLANLESLNSELIKQGMSKKDRLIKLQQIAISQLKSLDNVDFVKSVRNATDIYPELQEIKKDLKVEGLSDYNKKLKQALDFDAKKGKK